MPDLAVKLPPLPNANVRHARASRIAVAALLSLGLHVVVWQSVKLAPPAPPHRAALEARLVPQPRSESLFTLPSEVEPAIPPLPTIEEPPARMPTTSLLDPVVPVDRSVADDPAKPDTDTPTLPQLSVAPTDAVYYKAGEVDHGAQFLNEILPEYPAEAHFRGLTGAVDLVLYIDEAGQIRDITVERAEPPGFFEEAAIKAFRTARFSPALKNGRAVKSRKNIRVSFDLTQEP